MAEQIIRAGMEVVGSDGGHVGTVDGLGGGLLRLTCRDDPGGAGQQRFLALRLVDRAEAGQVRLTVGAQDARAVAFGALEARGEASDGDDDPQPGQVAAKDAGVAASDMAGQEGRGSGGDGETRHGHLGGGSGIPGDPNVDPRAGRDPKR